MQRHKQPAENKLSYFYSKIRKFYNRSLSLPSWSGISRCSDMSFGSSIFSCMRSQQLMFLESSSFFLSFSGLLVLDSSSFGRIVHLLRSDVLSLLPMNVFHQHSLVLEYVSLCLLVQFVVKMTVDLLLCSVLLEQSSQDSQSSHPKDLLGHSCISSSLPLSSSSMSTLSSCFKSSSDSSSRTNGNRLSNDKTILNQFPDMLS